MKLILMAALSLVSVSVFADDIVCYKKNGELVYQKSGSNIGVWVDNTGNNVQVQDRQTRQRMALLTGMSCVIKP